MSFVSQYKPVKYKNEATLLQDAYSTPERRLTTAWFRTNLGFFRVDITVVGPKAKQPENYLRLAPGETKSQLEKISNLVKFLAKHAWTEDPER